MHHCCLHNCWLRFFATLMLNSYGDITAKNNLEMAIAILIMIAGELMVMPQGPGNRAGLHGGLNAVSCAANQ
jgi:hypothetical protein